MILNENSSVSFSFTQFKLERSYRYILIRINTRNYVVIHPFTGNCLLNENSIKLDAK